MKKCFFALTAGLLLVLAGLLVPSPALVRAEERKAPAVTAPSAPDPNLSLRLEVRHAVEKALHWFGKNQSPDGSWSQAEYPALTALVLTAFMGEPSGQLKANPPDGVKKGYDFLLRCVQPDGGIYVKDMSNYNTAIAIMALVSGYNPTFEPVLRKARNFVVSLQNDFDEKGKTDNPLDGGIGYSASLRHADMPNTLYALEALHYTKFLQADAPAGQEAMKELNWEAARKFLERSQNLPGVNDQPWASEDPRNKGGFVYYPGNSMAGEEDLGNGRKALRSYGSISYAGLLSYVYAELKKDDPRVKAVTDWLRDNYTVEENPGMGKDGLFFYYHTMAKALAAARVDTLKLADGKEIDWRKDLAKKLLDLQRPEGFWANDSGRWWEKDPVLVTAYAAIAMEIVYRGL